MVQSGPNILVVDDDRAERGLIAAVLREAGFDVVVTAPEIGAAAAMSGKCFAAVVIALPGSDGIEFLREARRRQAAVKVLLVVEPEALHLANEDCATLVKRPFDLRELLGCVFALVLHEGEHEVATAHDHVAEFGIASARLACLHNRRDAAAAVGAHHLARDLARQIGEATASNARRAAAPAYGHLALVR